MLERYTKLVTISLSSIHNSYYVFAFTRLKFDVTYYKFVRKTFNVFNDFVCFSNNTFVVYYKNLIVKRTNV